MSAGRPAPQPGTPQSGTSLPAAVLWDMDGTLVDTEPYWIEAEFALVGEHGGTWSMEHAKNLVGNSLEVSGAYIAEHAGVDLAPQEIVRRMQRHVVSRAKRDPTWRPGARELLAALGEAGVRCALVTMSYRELAEIVVAQLPPGSFEVLVTGDEVTSGKPHPEPYLRAAELLGVDPGRCVALEDSPTGTTSARAAGVTVVAVPHVVPIEAAPGVTVVDSLERVDLDLLRLLAGDGVSET